MSGTTVPPQPTSKNLTPPSAPAAKIGILGILLTIATVIIAVVILRLPPSATAWLQGYDPTGHWWLSTLIAALPVVVLLGSLALCHVKAHYAALMGLATALIVAIFAFHMPGRLAAVTAVYGIGYGLFPIGWIVLNVIFMYQLTVESGRFKVLQHSMTGITQDRRLQLLLIAFCFGAFFEGASGFGTPVAVTAAHSHRPGLSAAAGLRPVADRQHCAGRLRRIGHAHHRSGEGNRVQRNHSRRDDRPHSGAVLHSGTVLADLRLCRLGSMLEIWPAILVAGVSFAIPEVLISNLHGPWLANIGSSVISMACLVGFLFIWHPKRVFTFEGEEAKTEHRADHGFSRADVTRAWVPWIILSVIVFVWGSQTGKKFMNTPEKVITSTATWQTPPSKITNPQFVVGGLNNLALRVPPVVTKPTKEPAVFGLNWVSATGSGILLAALISGLIMGLSVKQIFVIYGRTLVKVRFSLITIAAMMAIGFMTRYAGLDATMGLAFARTGHLYPFFGTLLGWLGVALTGSDTSSNVLFGSLQKITAQQMMSPILMASANSAGGVMGKMIDAQSIVVASTATQWYGHEGTSCATSSGIASRWLCWSACSCS